MAYNGRYTGNPDALPAHAEPEQAAAMLSHQPPPPQQHQPQQQQQQQQRYTTYGQGNKPPAPAPVPMQNPRTDDRYGRPTPPGAYHSASNSQSSYHSTSYDARPAPAPRYDNYSHQPVQPDRHRYSNAQQQAQPPPALPARNPYASPPPPATYGSGPRPSEYHNRPPIPAAQRPPTVPPPAARDGNDRDALWPLFMAVDADRSGQLSESSLRRALVNGDYTAFDPHTVKMMIRMFDTDRSGTINFDEFCGLWAFLAAWRNLFDRFDIDRSGHISFTEFSDALVAFGYRLSPQFVQLLFSTFARNVGGRGDDVGRAKGLSFDLFVQACISLKRMTDVFKKYDDDRDGYITLSFEEFLTGAQSLFLFNSISPATDNGLY